MRMLCLFAIAILLLSSSFVQAQENRKYQYGFPPRLMSRDLAAFEISEQAFPFYDGSLLVPDNIEVSYSGRVVKLEIVEGNEHRYFRPVASFDFDDWYLPDSLTYKITGDIVPEVERNKEVSSFLFFKQRMWIKGLLYAAREYENANGAKFKVDGFRVEFEQFGDFVRPSVRLYKRKTQVEPEHTMKQLMDQVSRSSEDIQKRLEKIEKEQRNTNKALDGISGLIASLKTDIISELNKINRTLQQGVRLKK